MSSNSDHPKLKAVTALELKAQKYPAPRVYGCWTLNEELLVLDHNHGYEVDLERCLSGAQVANWIFQIEGKLWHDTDAERAQCVGWIVTGLNRLLHPQGYLCPWGANKRKPKKWVRERVTLSLAGEF